MKKVLTFLISLCLINLVAPPLSRAKGRIPKPGKSANKGALFAPKGSAQKKRPIRPQQLPEIGDLNTLAGAGVTEAETVTINSQSEVNPDAVGPGAFPTDEQMEAFKQNRAKRVRKQWPLVEGPPARPGVVPPSTEPKLTAPAALLNKDGAVPLAANDITLFKTHAFNPNEVPLNLRNSVQEPTAINMGNTVFYTGNHYAAKSSNGGDTFTFINPSTFFPAVDGGFCCDQVTAYAQTHDMALWGLQYAQSQTTNTFRIARAVGSSGIAGNNWVSWDLTPSFFGYPSGTFFDYPSFTVTTTYLYVTTNPFDIASGLYQGSILIRIPLSQLAAGGGISYEFLKTTPADVNSPILCTENSNATTYCAAFRNTTQMRIYRWADASSTINFNDVNLNAFTYYTSGAAANSPDGTNWAAHSDSRPHGAYVANGIIGVMFNARQDETFPFPYVVHARFSESTRALVSQTPIWNPNYAYLYPTVTPNANGDLAGTFQIGGGSATSGFPYPGTVFWISDSVQPGGSSVGGLFSIVNSNAGPFDNKWGDYFSVQKHKAFPNTWVIANHVLNGGQSGSFAQPKYYWIGREKNGPAATTKAMDTAGVYNPATSFFFLKNSHGAGPADVIFGYGAGGAGWKPLAGDWNGDGMDTVGMYSPSNSTFFLRNTNSAGAANLVFNYGPAAGWLPIAGDWNADGVDTIGLYNPATSTFYLKNTNSAGAADLVFGYGPSGAGWLPLVGDWNSDGTETVGLYNPNTSTFFLKNVNAAGAADLAFGYGPAAMGWVPLSGDWNADGLDTIGLYDPANSAFYLKNTNSAGGADLTFLYGPAGAGWKPLDGDWDGQ